ncbi:MAG: methylenetetrahydrofolate reductase [Actinobacteria bacterium]|nr:methylenetetrahydrofolate reductase [Actinomycetota bacterium]MBS1900266.1 methylenetetrahydrofolate reductase [Actinomycetota bacterium]
MLITEMLAAGPTYSFEFFPPKTEAAAATLATALTELEPLAPSFVSVTYGAGGGTRELTHDVVTRFHRESSITAMAHLTCVCHTRGELEEIASRYHDEGIENLLALGGDPPKDRDLPPGDLEHAIELVRLLRGVGSFAIGVAAFPEPHPKSPSLADDRRRTAEKLAEADFAITQFFFDAEHYFDLVDTLRELGVDKPVIPGIMPATAISSIKRMTELQGSDFPEWLSGKLHAVQDDPEAVFAVGVEEATKLSRELLAGGAPGLHFITLNRSRATRLIYEDLGLTPAS